MCNDNYGRLNCVAEYFYKRHNSSTIRFTSGKILIKQHEVDYNAILKAWTTYLTIKKFICPSCKKNIHPICPKCNRPQSFRQRILTDFLIAGFALNNSNGIITLDPAYYKNYFPELAIFD